MKRGLIGYTGFVGSHLKSQKNFNLFYNSSNISDIEGIDFDLLVCAAPSAVKWRANKNPEEDLHMVNSLIDKLKKTTAKIFIHISTVDVYENTIKVNEFTKINSANLQPYGKHRFYLEQFVREHFTHHLIVRLPALFGKGLKKNFIYDLLHPEPKFLIKEKFVEIINFEKITNEEKSIVKNSYIPDKDLFKLKNGIDNMEKLRNVLKKAGITSFTFTHKSSQFQFYYLDNLWKDIKKAINNSIKLINFSTEPISSKEVAETVFNIEFDNETDKSPIYYDVRSKYYKSYYGNSGYLYKKGSIKKQLRKYLEGVKNTE